MIRIKWESDIEEENRELQTKFFPTVKNTVVAKLFLLKFVTSVFLRPLFSHLLASAKFCHVVCLPPLAL